MNKKMVLAILLGLLIIVFSISGFVVYEKIVEHWETDKLINEIRNSYSEYVTVLKDKTLYSLVDDKYVSVGTIYKDSVVSLVKKEIADKDDIYYQIKDSNYYIDYKDIKKTDKVVGESLDYVVTKSVKTNPTKLYNNDKLVFEIDEEFQFDVLLKDNDKYYVEFLNSIYYVKDNVEVIDKKGIEVLKDISVLSLDNISNDKLDEFLKYLQDNKYSSIDITDFKRWVTGQVSLEKNKVLLISNKELDNDKLEIVSNYGYIVNSNLDGLTFISGDTKLKVGATKYYKYDVNSNTTLSRFKDMLKGVKIKTTTSYSRSHVAVLNYHFFYDSSLGESCNESICLDVNNFRKQLQYLKDNNYKVLTMKEFNDWMDKKLTFSQKAVLITIDDGAMGTSFINGNKLIPILEEFQMPATLFLITGWWDIDNYKSEYLEVYSHGNELHHSNFCRNGSCGYKTLSLTKDELVADLQLSINKVGSNLAFCYPFYAKNDTMISALKETGFKLAFVGGNRKAKQSDNKYSVPRYIIYKNTSLNSFINMVK